MAGKRKHAQKQRLEVFESSGGKLFDKMSFLIGGLVGVIVFAIVLFAYSSWQHPYNPPPKVPVQPAQQTPGESKQPGGLEVSVKNNEKTPLRIVGVRVGNENYNLSGELAPGAVKAVNISPTGCAIDPEACQVLITYVIQVGQQIPGGNATSGTSNGGNASNGTIPPGGGSASPTQLTITTQSLATATQDAKYSFALEAIGGSGSYMWAASGLPTGLSMSSRGLISGAALVKGQFPIQITVADGTSSAAVELTLTVN